MIIYNHKKEFVGISEKDLKALKLSSLAELQNEVADFADLFVKTPGYIHNFKHVHWIDFIKSADSIDENRVIISVKGRNYKAVIDLQKLYLVDDPQQEAYGIVLSALRELTKEENERISGDLAQRSVLKSVEPMDFEQKESASEVETSSEPEIEEEPLTLDFEEETQEEAVQEEAPVELALDEEVSLPPQEESVAVEDEEDKFRDYHFDPELAAKELGLPTDLVEEFIQDFIAQAREFKPELYEALDTGRIDNLRMLSHKLKGVAANLRIEDAYDALVTINTSDDISLVKRTLDRFYNVIIKKLAGEEVPTAPKTSTSPAKEEPSDEEAPVTLDLGEEITLEAPSEEEMLKEEEVEPVQEEEEKLDLGFDEDIFQEESPALEAPTEDEPTIEIEEEEPVELSLDEEKEEPLELTLEDAIDTPQSSDSALQSQEEENLELVDDVQPDAPIVVDKARIASELGIDVQVYEELLNDYISDMHLGLQQLEELLQNGEDPESVKKLALRLKGMSDNMHLNTIAKEFEEFIQNDDANRVALLKKIKTQIDSIERA